MNEIPEILEKKEKTEWEGKPKYWPYIISAFFGSIIAGVLIGIFAGSFLKSQMTGVIIGIVVFCLTFLWGNLNYRFTHYALTDRRIILQSGIFGRSFRSINYDDVKNASVSIGLFNWLFGTGSIKVFTGEIESTGGKDSQIRPKYDSFMYISGAYDVLKELQEHLTEMEENMYGGKNVVQRVKIMKQKSRKK